MIVIYDAPREWRETAAAARSWPATKRDELVRWMWTRPEPHIRVMADVIERPNVSEVQP